MAYRIFVWFLFYRNTNLLYYHSILNFEFYIDAQKSCAFILTTVKCSTVSQYIYPVDSHLTCF